MTFTPDEITRIILRNDTSENWEKVSDSAILLAGEIGIEFTKDKKLPYISGNPSDLQAILKQIEAIEEILQTDLSDLSDQVATNKTSIENLQKLIGENGEKFTQLQTAVDQQKENIITLNNLGLSVNENGSICLTYEEII